MLCSTRSFLGILLLFVSFTGVGHAEDLVANALETVGTPVGGATFIQSEISPQTLLIADLDDGVVLPHSQSIAAPTGDFAIGFWFRPTEGPTGAWRIITYKGDAGNERNFGVYLFPDSMRLHYRISTENVWNDGGNSLQELALNHWYHIAYVRKGNQLSLYLNGRLDSSDTLDGEPISNTGQLYLGNSPFNPPALGELADVNIYRRTLSSLEIRSLFTAKRPPRDLEEQGEFEGTPTLLPESGRSGQILQLDSDDDAVVLPNSVVLTPGTTDFSAAFWVRLDSEPNGSFQMIARKGATETDRTFAIGRRPDDNRLQYRISTQVDSDEGNDSAAELVVGEWTHVAYVKRGNSLELFLNGVLDSSHSLGGAVVYNDGPLRLGLSGTDLPARASLDDVSLWNYALRAEEVLRLMSDTPTSVAEQGEWGPIIPWPVVPVSMANLPDGRILAFSGSERTTWPSTEQTYSSIWDPTTGEFDDLFQAGHNMFCAHLAMTEQGEVFVNGGRNNVNSPWATLFDYRDNQWQQIDNMATGGRWYPVTNALPNGEVITSMGTASNLRNPEAWSRVGSWRVLNNVDYVDMRQTFEGTTAAKRWWPILSVAPSGELFHYWNAGESHFIDTSGTGTVRSANTQFDIDHPTGVAIQFDAGKMLMTGGNQGSRTPHGNNDRAYTIDLNGPSASVVQTQPMKTGRTFHNLVPLPTGEVIAVGGSRFAGGFNNRGAVYQAEIWDPDSGEWTLTAPAMVPRNYHSTALLLSDGRVLSAGGGYGSNNEWIDGSSHQNGQVFTPPYLYAADGTLADRPTIDVAPGTIRAGQAFNVTASPDIQRFSMIRMSATTHAVNTDSRFLWLEMVDHGSGSFTLTPEANPNIVLPGYWMIFGLDANDVPTVAHVARVERSAGVTTPGTLRYVKLVALSEVDGNPWASAAEIDVLDGNGDVIDRSSWQVSATSQEPLSGVAEHVVDGDPATLWHTEWGQPGTEFDPPHPHEIVIDLGTGYTVTGLEYLPRQVGTNGRILDYQIEVSPDGIAWTLATSGTFPNDPALQHVPFGADLGAVVVTSPAPSSAGSDATFEVAGAGDVDYTWSWGDGSTAMSTGDGTILHAYAAPGRYTVVVTVFDPSTSQSDTHEFVHVVYDSSIDPTTPNRWMASTSVAYHPDLPQIWNVNPDNDSVTAIDAESRVKLVEIAVGEHPAALAFDGAGLVWVTNKADGTLSVIDPATLSLVQTLALPNENGRPHGIVAAGDQNTILVALEASGELAELDASLMEVTQVVPTIDQPRHLAVNPERDEFYVTSFITPLVEDESTGTPNPSAGVPALQTFSLTGLAELGTAHFQYSDRARTENSGPGIPNYLGSIAVHPAGLEAFVPSKQDNILGGALRTGGALTFDQAVRAISSQVSLDGATTNEVLPGRIEHDNASVATAAVYGPWGIHLFTALEGNRQVAISLPDNNAEIARFDVGRAPQGLALSPDGMQLAVHNFMDRTIQLLDISGAVGGNDLSVETLATVDTVANELLGLEVFVGKQLFYDSKDDRLAGLDYMSCASCHEDGGHDGRVWDFTQFGEGLRNTQSLRGKGGMDHGLLHWTGNFDEVQDFEGQIRSFAAGMGLMEDADFFAGTRIEPLGDPKAGLSADLDALAAYIASLDKTDSRVLPGQDLSPEGEAGEILFSSLGCRTCHTGTTRTDSTTGARHDIGTLTSDSGMRLGEELDGLDTPTLLGLATSAPYLHDGSAETLEIAIDAHVSTTISPEELDALNTFLLEFPGDATGSPEIINGSFEFPVVLDSSIFSDPYAIGGWIVTSGNVEIARTPWPAAEGDQSTDLNGDLSGSLSQTVTGFMPGVLYELRFQYGLNANSPTAQSAEVRLDGEVIATVVADLGMLPPQFQPAIISFEAPANGEATFEFSSLSGDSFGVIIDDVQIVPEPSFAALLSIGLGGIAALGRARSRRGARSRRL